jgi:hypothetical protein
VGGTGLQRGEGRRGGGTAAASLVVKPSDPSVISVSTSAGAASAGAAALPSLDEVASLRAPAGRAQAADERL